MTSHGFFAIVAAGVLALWAIALLGYLPPLAKRLRFPLGTIAFALSWLVMVGYMAWLWHALQRPPMRTMGETRLWYIFFLPLITLVLEWRWRTRSKTETSITQWMVFLIVAPTIAMGTVFMLITLCHPESLDKSMMPALRSPWFAPHVIVYMVAYAMMGVAAFVAVIALVIDYVKQSDLPKKLTEEAHRLVYIAFPLVTLGLILGAFWAKIAWGNYWSWDPKETGAFITWAMYLAYIHLERYTKLSPRLHLGLIAGVFLVVLGCWFGVNALPSAQMSVHTYANTN